MLGRRGTHQPHAPQDPDILSHLERQGHLCSGSSTATLNDKATQAKNVIRQLQKEPTTGPTRSRSDAGRQRHWNLPTEDTGQQYLCRINDEWRSSSTSGPAGPEGYPAHSETARRDIGRTPTCPFSIGTEYSNYVSRSGTPRTFSATTGTPNPDEDWIGSGPPAR